MKSGLFKRLGKTCALVTASLILPVLAYAGTDNGKGNNGQNNGNQNGHHDPVVAEVPTVWVLLPIVGAVLILSWRKFSRAKESP
jgi:hypothetical protein